MQETNQAPHGRYLGVDYGDKRTGLAVSDISGFLAGAIGQISPGGMKNTAVCVAAEAARQNAVLIVVGLPKNMDGSEGFRAEAVRAFVALLAEETEIPIVLSDERLSTCEAHRYIEAKGKKRKAVIDTLSAQIILQDYLDAERNKNR